MHRIDVAREWAFQACGDLSPEGSGKLLVRARADEAVLLSLPTGWSQTIRADGSWQRLDVGPVPIWEPGAGGTVTLSISCAGQLSTRQIGFRSLTWRPCEHASESARPWVCVVNGQPTFLAGATWGPVRAKGTVREADYRRRLDEYRRIGINSLRLTGEAIDESDIFYDLCDEYGLLVWQELPLAGAEPTAPPDELVRPWVTRLGHHPCLMLWAGGDTGQADSEDDWSPRGLEHPVMAGVAEALSELDPLRTFVPSSPSGPRRQFSIAEAGQGLHHDVVGPLEFDGDWAEWTHYWACDDSLMRSAVAISGASDRTLCEAPETADGAQSPAEVARLTSMVNQSQTRQAAYLAHAAAACQARFPAIGGFFVASGHDAKPCSCSPSLLDGNGDPKPVAEALREVFVNRALPQPGGASRLRRLLD